MVTLASLFPVLAVEIMGIMISVTKTPEEIINSADAATSDAAVRYAGRGSGAES